MRTEQTTLAILFFLLASCAILSAVWYVYFVYKQNDTVLCPEQLKKCPDGTFIDLGGPSCSYPKCPAPKPSASTNQGSANVQSLTQSQSPVADEVVRSFYGWFQKSKSVRQPKQIFGERQDLTDAFKTRLEQAGNNVDPLLCVAGKLDSFDTVSVFASDSRSVVLISLNDTTGARDAAVELVENNGAWQINDVFCPTGSGGSPTAAVTPEAGGSQSQPPVNDIPEQLKVQ